MQGADWVELRRHVRSWSWRILPQAAQLQSDVPEECRIIAEISLPQTARILDEPMHPLHTYRFDPLRRVLDAAGMKVVGGTDTEHECGIESMQVAMHEALLFGRADADPDDIGPELSHMSNERLLFLFIEVAKWRRVGADDACPRILACEPLA